MLNVHEIPLSKLVPSPANVRRTGRNEGIGELAASIKAHGLLQNLTVRKGSGDNKGCFEVVAGGRRLAALQKLAKRKHIAQGEKIPCHVIEGESAVEISLAENVLQCPMHPADQYEAFAKLHNEQDMSAEDIGARFGVSSAVVRQRLKLGSVSPKLMKLYRAGELNLDQLTAFAITDDHKAQERVWKELPSFNNGRSSILDALTEGQVPHDDRRAVFVGADAYEAAGGCVVRNLFDGEGGGYFTELELLNHLVREKLQRTAKKIVGEGWKWVSVEPDFDHGAAADMRRVHAKLSAEDQAKVGALEARHAALWDTDDENPDADAEIKRIEAEIEALAANEQYHPDDIARAGAFVCLGHDGKPHIARGYLRKEDEREEAEATEAGEDAETGKEPQPKLLSDKLITDLTAARTSALRSELTQAPAVALVAVTHALALQSFYGSGDGSCLELRARQTPLFHQTPEIAESLSERQLAERHQAWEKSLPESEGELWGCITTMKQPECLRLLAHCVALTVNAVHDGKSRGQKHSHADALASALSLDMTTYWQPTSDNYFGRVSKERITEALHEAGCGDAVPRIAAMKKQAMAEAAQAALAGKGWLPALLRTP